MTFDVQQLREREFPWTASGDTIFLNSASTGPLPQRSIDAAMEMTSRRARPSLIPDTEIFATLSRSRSLLARLVNCSSEEIALVPNTSMGVNLAAQCLPFRSGDVVLTFEREFPANVYPWMTLEKRGVELRFIRCVNGLPDEELLMQQLDDDRVRCVAVSWVQFASGYTVDLETLGRECRSRGIYFVVDGIQGLGPLTLDLNALNVDIFASGCQKWLLSPWGTGFAYVRRELIQSLDPYYVGWLAFKGSEDFNNLTRYAPEFRDDARKFEVGTHGLQDYAALNASLDLFLSTGPENIVRHVAALTSRLTDWAAHRSDVKLLSPRNAGKRAGIVSLSFADSVRVAESLRAAGVVFSLREGAIRLACHMFNSDEEIARVIGLLEGSL